MKTITKLSIVAISLLLMSISVYAQKLSDAQKAIDAEQYQKARSLLKNLIASEPTKDENYFYLGWVYLLQDYADSAKNVFSKGIAANPKSALNYAGLGAVAKLDNDQSAETMNFDKAVELAGKNDKPYIYISKAYLMSPNPNADLALATLNKATKAGAKDPYYFIALGDAYHVKLDNNQAYSNYNNAQTLDAKLPAIDVAIGSLWKQANNFDGAVQKLNEALTLDPNYGPAYRELAETDLRWAQTDMKVASVKVKEGAANYKKFLDLTDRSPESQLRYADFLMDAGDYKSLEALTAELSKSPKANLRVYRYLGYAAYENNNYQEGLTAINKFIKEAAPKRIIPRDYLYLGHLQIKSNQDSLGMLNLEKAASLDSSLANVYAEIGHLLYTKHKYVPAGDAYQKYIDKSHEAKLLDHFYEGMSYYYGYSDQYYDFLQKKSTVKPDSLLLTKADSAFSYVQQKTAAKPVADVFLYRARLNDLKEPDRNNMKAYAKPFYEQYIAIKSADQNPDTRTKKNLGEAYAYLGSYYDLIAKDDSKAAESYEKARTFYPESKEAQAYFGRKTTRLAKGK